MSLPNRSTPAKQRKSRFPERHRLLPRSGKLLYENREGGSSENFECGGDIAISRQKEAKQ